MNLALQRQFVEIVAAYVAETGISPPDFELVVAWAVERGLLEDKTERELETSTK